MIFKRLIIGSILIQMSSNALASTIYSSIQRVSNNEIVTVLPAKEARDTFMQAIYVKHQEAIDYWVKTINAEVLNESTDINASTLVDITTASLEVQEYLEMAYVRAGYCSVKLIPDYDRTKPAENPPVITKMYLGLSW